MVQAHGVGVGVMEPTVGAWGEARVSKYLGFSFDNFTHTSRLYKSSF